MINFEKFFLDNGLQVVVHQAPHSLVAAVNIMYHVGARDEDPTRTGLAHLCEHLMFTGSQNIPTYDTPLQEVGGTNNAYTSSDLTSYYCTLPVANLETAFWLESDRMLGLALNENSLAIQKKVVIEEFKEVYLNQPYGDAWSYLSQLSYTVHPYQWPVIGKDISHIEKVNRSDVQAFLKRFYIPNNATLVVAGAVEVEDVKKLAQKWFGSIPKGALINKNFTPEPIYSHSARTSTLARPVPMDALYKAYHVPGQNMPGYDAVELFAVALGNGKSSRLYQQLVVDNHYFNNIELYTTQTFDPGLLVISGRVNPEIKIETAEAALSAVIETARIEGITDQELDKAKNHLEADFFYDNIDIAQRAEELAIATWLGDTDGINTRLLTLNTLSLQALNATMETILKPAHSITLYYQKS